MFGVILILFLCAWLAHIYLKIERKKVKLPGPPLLPILGAFFHMDMKKGHEMIYKFTEKYGDLMYFNVMNLHFVCIGDAKLAREMFSVEDLSGRPNMDIMLMYPGKAFGVLLSEGELWEVHRRFTLRHLRDFGFGKNAMEALILDEVREFADRLKISNGKPVGEIKEKLSLAVVNSLWKVVSGTRFSQDDPKLTALSNNVNNIFTAPAESNGIIYAMPWLRYIIPEYTGYNKVRKAFDELEEFVTDAVKEHETNFQPEACQDFIDVFLKEMKNTSNDPTSTFHGEDGRRQLISTIADLFFAGKDTTSTALAWAVLYVATHPQVQQKIQDEITSITGDTRQVSVADRSKMPYLQATIEEILRKSAIVPSGIAHTALRDVTINGILYPKGTMIHLNIYYIQNNPKTWGDPQNFRPERFLSEDGKTFQKSENVVPFSVGKRQCLGETLAKDSIFLFIANILQQFNVKVDPNQKEPSLEPVISLLLNPQEYSVVFEVRAE